MTERGEVVFDLTDREPRVVKDARGEDRVCARGERGGQMVGVRGTAARHDRHLDSLGDRAQQLEVVPRAGAVAVPAREHDLARAALAERNRAEEAGVLLQRDLALLEDTLQKLAADITALQAKIKDAKARQSALILRNQAGQARLGARRQLADHTIDDALRRFEDYERKMDDLEGQIESYDLSRRTLADEIADLETSERLDAELSALKTRMAGQVAGTVRTSDKEP